MRHTLPVGALAAAALLALSACASDTGSSPSGEASGGSEIALVKDGVLTVCSNPPFEPFEFEDASGEIVGLDIDLNREVAKDLGVDVQVVATPFDTIQSGAALNTGACDVVASGITITDDRKEKFDFSEPYFDADQGLLVPAGSDLQDVADLAGKKVAVQMATTGEKWAQENDLTTVQFEDLGLQIQALETGQVDAVVNDIAVLGAYTSEGYEVANTFPTGEQYGLGVKKGNTALLDAVNATLDRIHEDGTYDAIYTERVGTAPVSK
ncbi:MULTISPECIES: basic amino acid ABC transporter substrate-binding protein [Cellulomonas]|jgi:polar amino acid transport system substrate-binding protein|uniref:basic amino acid ABC transporter substrate-binding protein n=1 Tax=Cellulomonas TaxID=1707 RepID=UPI000625107A|nr:MULTISPECIES: basic amino acid ABC transporter substrate-binding protein [Cellulomonas]MBO9569283.1 basic amino acid ABC transporter substrate-binding protein [Cellulomonas iranensis]UCN13471.1 basic amino acid ABC transporter substrate-binding protein [Cellulomonas iranensis]